MLIDNYNPDTLYNGHTDTFWYSGVRGKVGIMCDTNLINIKNYVPFLQGCERDGYISIRYVIGNKKTNPIIYKH